jgi:hypothetical protein
MDDDRISPMTQMRGVGSRPTTLTNKYVNATSLGGTVEKLETGMTGIYSGCRPEPCNRNEPALRTRMNETLGQVVACAFFVAKMCRIPTVALRSIHLVSRVLPSACRCCCIPISPAPKFYAALLHCHLPARDFESDSWIPVCRATQTCPSEP